MQNASIWILRFRVKISTFRLRFSGSKHFSKILLIRHYFRKVIENKLNLNSSPRSIDPQNFIEIISGHYEFFGVLPLFFFASLLLNLSLRDTASYAIIYILWLWYTIFFPFFEELWLNFFLLKFFTFQKSGLFYPHYA